VQAEKEDGMKGGAKAKKPSGGEQKETSRGIVGLLFDIIEFLPDATLVIDRAGRVIAWNRTMEEMTGVKAADILGKA